MYKNLFAYSTANSYRSAISALNVGEHPEVCSLLAGIFNQRPPQPKYAFIWDVQIVIDFIEHAWSINHALSDKQLTLKLTILLALTSPSRTLGS